MCARLSCLHTCARTPHSLRSLLYAFDIRGHIERIRVCVWGPVWKEGQSVHERARKRGNERRKLNKEKERARETGRSKEVMYKYVTTHCDTESDTLFHQIRDNFRFWYGRSFFFLSFISFSDAGDLVVDFIVCWTIRRKIDSVVYNDKSILVHDSERKTNVTGWESMYLERRRGCKNIIARCK